MKRNNSSPTSKPTSVDIRTLFLKAIATNNQKGDFSKEEIVIADEYTAKINRLIVEARLNELNKVNVASSGWELQTEDILENYVTSRIKALTKELGSLDDK